MYPAHRVSWEVHNGEIPVGMNVLHRCDNAGCVNPAHLFLGTQADNIKDMFAKGRQNSVGPKGEAARTARLTAPQVSTIRLLYRSGVFSNKWLQAVYGMPQSAIWKVVNRKTWRHVA